MQWLPVSPTECLIREIGYVRKDSRRDVRLARHLNWRINRQVNAEDAALIARVTTRTPAFSMRANSLVPSAVRT